MSSLWTPESGSRKCKSIFTGFSTQSAWSLNEYVTKLKRVADYIKKTSIAELDQMPNRYIHAMYYMAYQQNVWDREHPKEAEQRMMGEALSGAL